MAVSPSMFGEAAAAATFRADLDGALLLTGESVRLLRMARAPASAKQVTCPALIRGYQPVELSPQSGIEQQDQLMILSPTPLLNAGWPGAGLSPVPIKGDRVVTSRGTQTVQAAVGVYVQDVLVRIECQLRGM